MSSITTAAAIAKWIEDCPQAAAEVVKHLGEDKAERLLALKRHFPENFGDEQTREQYQLEQDITEAVGKLVEVTDKQCALEVLRQIITAQLTN